MASNQELIKQFILMLIDFQVEFNQKLNRMQEKVDEIRSQDLRKEETKPISILEYDSTIGDTHIRIKATETETEKKDNTDGKA